MFWPICMANSKRYVLHTFRSVTISIQIISTLFNFSLCQHMLSFTFNEDVVLNTLNGPLGDLFLLPTPIQLIDKSNHWKIVDIIKYINGKNKRKGCKLWATVSSAFEQTTSVQIKWVCDIFNLKHVVYSLHKISGDGYHDVHDVDSIHWLKSLLVAYVIFNYAGCQCMLWHLIHL